MNLQVRFGTALQFVRKKKGLTQEDFSIVSSRTYLSTLERGLKSPTLEKVEQISTVLNVHPLTLLALAYVGHSPAQMSQLCQRIEKEVALLCKVPTE